MRVRSMVTALFLAGTVVIPLSGSSAAAASKSAAACREGAMFAAGQGYYTCAQGQYVYRDCGPGTHAVQQGQDNVFCDYDR
ncbi:hypothetical protein [Streptomyces sp. NPDC007205]|uniref:hypothetical protein n=1 Tax=Streptomyces sp. NPDC007205 TaxID=3154316 RepID=UPI0033EF65B5